MELQKVTKAFIENDVYTLPEEQGNLATSLEYISKFNISKTARILDLGCGYGSLIYNLKLNGYDNVYGIEVNKERVEKGRIAYPNLSESICTYSGEIIPYQDSVYDLILMFDVIEHIPDVETFIIKEVYRVLKDNGLLIFQTPNKLINIPWEVVNNKSFSKWKQYHCSLQTRNSLAQLLVAAGFRKVVIEKNSIITKHNVRKVKSKLGIIGLMVLYMLQFMPLSFYPNFWGSGIK